MDALRGRCGQPRARGHRPDGCAAGDVRAAAGKRTAPGDEYAIYQLLTQLAPRSSTSLCLTSASSGSFTTHHFCRRAVQVLRPTAALRAPHKASSHWNSTIALQSAVGCASAPPWLVTPCETTAFSTSLEAPRRAAAGCVCSASSSLPGTSARAAPAARPPLRSASNGRGKENVSRTTNSCWLSAAPRAQERRAGAAEPEHDCRSWAEADECSRT